jgi:hypothetical protein
MLDKGRNSPSDECALFRSLPLALARRQLFGGNFALATEEDYPKHHTCKAVAAAFFVR